MSDIQNQKYSADAHIAELYDRHETQTDDVELLRRLIGERKGLTIFEPFCGSGRLTLPLARDGHLVTAVDESGGMLDLLRRKLSDEPEALRRRVRIVQASVFACQWPDDLDLVLLGGNCLYEVNSSDEQRALIHRAADALAKGGHLFLDNDDHQSGQLQPQWRKPPGQARRAFPTGDAEDGTRLEGSTETEWYDLRCRLVHYVRRLVVTHPDGRVDHHQWRETCHPVIMAEQLEWLGQAGLKVEQTFGDRQGNPYGPESPRCLIWARRD